MNCVKEMCADELLKKYNHFDILTWENIVEDISRTQKGYVQRVCPHRNVPISHAKLRIKKLWAKTKGHQVRDEEDRLKFISRLDELEQKNIGESWIISKIKDAGSYGFEYREASWLMVCTGTAIAKKIIEKNSKGTITKRYIVFNRIDGEPCDYFNTDNILKINKNEKIRLTNKDTCQCYRQDFIKKRREDGFSKNIGHCRTSIKK